MGSDFALDSMWCGGAALYKPSAVPCAIFTVNIEHDDTRTLSWPRNPSSTAEFVNRSHDLERIVFTQVGPTWWQRTEQLRRRLALHEIALLKASNNTCFEQRNGQPHDDGAVGSRLLLSKRLPCNLTRLQRFPRQMSQVGDIVLSTSSAQSQSVKSKIRAVAWPTSHLKAAAANAIAPISSCCRSGWWECCY